MAQYDWTCTARLDGGTGEPESRDTLTPGDRCGEYIVESWLAAGGFGTVYVGRHRILDRRAAIKVLHRARVASPTSVSRFVQEARLVNQIGHPNIVDVYELGQLTDGRPYLVMELLAGTSLAARLDAGPLPLAEALEIGLALASALAAAHAQGVVHRDIKPANVFLVENARGGVEVKILDFGIAKQTDARAGLAEATQTGIVVLGSPPYASPEQAAGAAVGPASDVYGLGVLLYHSLLGRLPFERQSTSDFLFAHMHDPPPRPRDISSEIPRSVDQLLLAMLAKAPGDRPDLPAVEAALRSVVGEIARRRRTGRVPRAIGIALSASVVACIVALAVGGDERATRGAAAPTLPAATSTPPSAPASLATMPAPPQPATDRDGASTAASGPPPADGAATAEDASQRRAGRARPGRGKSRARSASGRAKTSEKSVPADGALSPDVPIRFQ